MHMNRHKVLIVDDVAINRQLLEEILSDEYDIETATNGKQALRILQDRHHEIHAVLLDLVMPEYDGIWLLQQIRKEPWYKNTAYIMISTETDKEAEQMCFDLGVADFIHKPYDSTLIVKRVTNIVQLIDYQRTLQQKIDEQTKALVDQNRQLTEYAERLRHSKENIVSLLGTVVESRDAESGEHIARVREYTRILCRYVQRYYPEYSLDDQTVEHIVTASPLHDIGKIAIPDSILLKTGKLTDAEYRLMQEHTILGADIIRRSADTFDDDFRKIAADICMFHHERYDGKGYPLSLYGDEIPIHAQIVALADVYDALVHQRVYKQAYTSTQAIDMICAGESGVFNPKLLDCLLKAQDEMAEDGK